jgi:hypothetical protein
MRRPFLLLAVTTGIVGCSIVSRPPETVVTVSGQKYCIKHCIPLISVRGFSAKPLMLVHMEHPRCYDCGKRAPNHIWDSQHLVRAKLHPRRTIVTYCPLCEAEFWQCLGGDHQFSQADIQQITFLVSCRSDIRKPILRIVADDADHA